MTDGFDPIYRTHWPRRCLTTYMRSVLIFVAWAIMAAACDNPQETLPLPPPPQADGSPDPGYLIAPRPGCSSEVREAIDADVIARIAARGGMFTCGAKDEPLPLDKAVVADNPTLVRALLEAHADPNARWGYNGDRFPLQEALEARSDQNHSSHRSQIVEMLLQHGADPNQRWCPFESRGGGVDAHMACISQFGVTPLLFAAAMDDAGLAFVLLRACADPRLESRFGANALDLAYGEAVFQVLLSATVPTAKSGSEALAYLDNRRPRSMQPRAWDQTVLTRAIAGSTGGLLLSPPPPSAPPPPREFKALPSLTPPHRSYRVGRVRALLSLGADPNERLVGGVDWTPLGVAVATGDAEVVTELLARGADANARWCVPIPIGVTGGSYQPGPGCVAERGMTPLMVASSLGRPEVMAALLRANADTSLTDWDHRTALDYAVHAQHQDIAEMLRQAARWRSLVFQASRANQ
jgi:ankyrin repeat protein